MSGFVIGPVPAESNPAIEPENYNPSRFEVTNISLGQTTTVTTELADDYYIGQQVRLLVPKKYGSYQLNQLVGYVISQPSSTQVVVTIDSSKNVNAFIPTPYTAVITAATQANPCVLTASNYFSPNQIVTISGVVGMTQLNGNSYTITSRTSTTITLNVDSTTFTAYTSDGLVTALGGIQTIPEIIPIGDVNSGRVNASGRTNNATAILGSFINVSPA